MTSGRVTAQRKGLFCPDERGGKSDSGKADAFRAGVNVEAIFADESDQSLTALGRKLNREAGGRGDGGDDRDARREGLLQNLEGGTPADHEDMPVEGQQTIEQAEAYYFVHGVVPSDIFTGDDQATQGVKDRRTVKSAGKFKSRLRPAQHSRQLQQCAGADGDPALDFFEVAVNRLNGSLAAQSAARRGEDMSRELREVHLDARCKEDIDDVAVGVAGGSGDFENVRLGADESLRHEKAGGQFVIVSRRAHGHDDGAGVHLDVEGFLGGQMIPRPAWSGAVLPAQDGGGARERSGVHA